jgi:hypothetical protein
VHNYERLRRLTRRPWLVLFWLRSTQREMNLRRLSELPGGSVIADAVDPD